MQINPKNFRTSTRFEPMPNGLCVSAAVLYQLSYEDPYIGSSPVCWWFILTRERNETSNEDHVDCGNTNFKWRFDRHSGNCTFKQFRQMSLPAPNVSVFIAQLLKHCSANTEARSSNPVEVPTSFRVKLQLL